jgi:hypothetical protein
MTAVVSAVLALTSGFLSYALLRSNKRHGHRLQRITGEQAEKG